MTNSYKKIIYDAFRDELASMSLEEAVDFTFKDSASNCRNERYLKELLSLKDVAPVPTAVIMLDVTEFQKVNYRYGSVFGQKVLKKLGNFLLNYFKDTDEVIRYYGDVFVIIMYDTNPDDVLIRISEVIDQAESLEFSSHPELALNIIAGGCIVNALSNDALVDADRMLHKAKKQQYKCMFEQIHSNWTKEFILR